MTLLTRAARRLTRHVRETPELRAWQAACREAGRVPRRTPGRIRLGDYDVAYADLLTLCPQWHDLFVRGTLEVALSNPQPFILDCGANVGLASLFFMSRYPAARIRAFEADPALAAVLEENLRRNHADTVEVARAAVWTFEGTVDFQQDGADAGAIASLPGAAVTGARTRVPCVRLRDILEERPVDFLKLDIEGAEAAVLADCGPALSNVKALCVEVHELDPAERHLPGILAVLSSAGFAWTLDQLLPVPSMDDGRPAAPFAHGASAWVMLVKAWRP